MDKEQENMDTPQETTQESDQINTIPETVKDVESYKRWLEMKEMPALKLENRMMDTSDDQQIDPMVLPHILTKRISHLPLEEQETIQRRHKALKVLQMKISSEHMKAFGTPKRNGHTSLQRVLLDERAAELIEYFGRYFTIPEVHKIVTTEWGYSVQIGSVRQFRKRNLDKITARQEHHKRDYGELRLSHKKSRLEELQELYADRKQKYQVSGTKDDYKLLLQTLQQIQKECEIDTIRLEGQINHNVEVTLNYHIEQEVMKNMTINDIIIGRVAARNGVSTNFLIERLHSSLYARFSGFSEPEDPNNLMNQEIQYPSAIVYNWDQIRKIEDEKVKADKELMAHKTIPEETKEEMGSVKSVLQQRLDEMKGDLNKASGRVDDQIDKKSNNEE